MENLKKRATSALLWDLLGTFSQHGVGFIISIFLARLLEPTEFGLIGMALVVINIFQVFTDFGFASALIQNRENTSVTYSSIFFINVISGILLCLLFQISSPYIGKFYGEQRISELVRWLSLSLIISSFNIVQRTILRRSLEVKSLTMRIVASQIIGGVVGVLMAFKGYGVYALIAQNLVGSLTGTIVLWRTSEWFPRWEFSWVEVKKLSGFSSFMFLDKIATSIFSQINTLFVGKMFSPATLGYYARAESLNNLISEYSSSGIAKVFFPVLSSTQDKEEQFFRIYYTVISVISFLSFGLTGLLFIWGDDIIHTLFGSKWEPSVFIFRIIILKAFAYPVSLMMVNAFISKGKARENFWNGLIRRSSFIVSICFGFYFGFEAFLIADVVMNYVFTVVNIFFMAYYLKASIGIHLKKIFEGALVFIVLILFCTFVLPNPSFLEKMLIMISYGVCYMGFNLITKNEGLRFILKNAIQFYKAKVN